MFSQTSLVLPETRKTFSIWYLVYVICCFHFPILLSVTCNFLAISPLKNGQESASRIDFVFVYLICVLKRSKISDESTYMYIPWRICTKSKSLRFHYLYRIIREHAWKIEAKINMTISETSNLFTVSFNSKDSEFSAIINIYYSHCINHI